MCYRGTPPNAWVQLFFFCSIPLHSPFPVLHYQVNSCRTGVQQECQEDLVSVHTRSSAKQLLDRGRFVRLFLWILPNQKVTSLWVVAHTDMHRKTKRPAEHLDYWATGLLGNRTKCRQKKVRVFFNVSGDSHLPRAKKSLEKHFTRILLLQSLWKFVCTGGVLVFLCVERYSRPIVSVLPIGISDCRLFPVSSFSISERIFLASRFYGAEGCCRGRRPLSNPPPIVLVLIVIVHCHSQL